MKKESRNLAFDLLKVLSIIGIIILHYNNKGFGGGLNNPSTSDFNKYVYNIMEAFMIIGPNLFVLISGYYLCKNDKVKVRKILDFIIMLIFYGVLIYVLAVIFKITNFSKYSLRELYNSIINHWFIDIYIVMYILHPYFNKIINNKKKNNIWL